MYTPVSLSLRRESASLNDSGLCVVFEKYHRHLSRVAVCDLSTQQDDPIFSLSPHSGRVALAAQRRPGLAPHRLSRSRSGSPGPWGCPRQPVDVSRLARVCLRLELVSVARRANRNGFPQRFPTKLSTNYAGSVGYDLSYSTTANAL